MIGLIIIKCLRSGHMTDVDAAAAAATDDVAVVVAAEWADVRARFDDSKSQFAHWMNGFVFFLLSVTNAKLKTVNTTIRMTEGWMTEWEWVDRLTELSETDR